MNNLGSKIRKLRKQHGFTLAEFASLLKVSIGYLSNLENGKTENIPLSILEKIQDELHLFPHTSYNHLVEDDLFVSRSSKSFNSLQHLYAHHPDEAEFILALLEKSLSFYSGKFIDNNK